MKYLPPIVAGMFLLGACNGIVDDPANVGMSPPGGGSGGSKDPDVTPGSGGSIGQGGVTGRGGSDGSGGSVGAGGSGGSLGAGGTTTGSGGTPGSGGTMSTDGGMGGSSGDAGADVSPPPPPPPQNGAIDFSIWSLQLPTGSGNSPTTISASQLQGGYTSAYFYKATDGGYMFMSPQQGITTPGSQHTRTEMRENSPGGGQAAWTSTGTNVMTVTGKVHKVGGTVAVGQLFIGTDSIPLCELFYVGSTNAFQILYEEAKGAGQNIKLNVTVPLGTKYTYSLALTAGQLIVTIDGKVAYTRRPGAGTLGKRFYFKAGAYEQKSTAGTPNTTPFTVVQAYSVSVVHK